MIAEYSESVAKLLPAVGSNDFCRLLVDLLKNLVPIDEASIIVYETASLPVFQYAVPAAVYHPNVDVFVKGAFLLDPYYIAATKHRQSGFFRLRDIAPPGFRQSEYFRIYYRRSGLYDECGYLVRIQNSGFVNIALGRTDSRTFTRAQTRLLEDISPLIDNVCSEHWRLTGGAATFNASLRGQLETALQCFGESVLTNREREVVHLVLVGHSTKKLADLLRISPETVKLHRKHAYAKLGVRTQSELFYLFIDSLMSIDGYHDGDPLTPYQQNSPEPESLTTLRR